MLRLLRPSETAATIFDVEYDRLYRNGKRVILFDLDNTLGAGKQDDVSSDVIELLDGLVATGFRVGIISNRRWIREDTPLLRLRGRFAVRFRARKPRRAGFVALLEELKGTTDEAVMIGDRRITDVAGANRMGIYSFLLRRRRSICA
jgi:HAD superfamily phosphatase (TIGR01668 family)